MRTIFIGDVHGCFVELRELLEKVDFDPLCDRLIFLGDLINRGPFSGKVLQLVHSIPCEVILGNHELGLLKYTASISPPNSYFEEVLAQIESEKEYYLSWMQDLPTFIESEHFLAIHGGLVPNLAPKDHSAEDITNLRFWQGRPWFEQYLENKLVVYGHWAEKGLTVRKNTIGLDSGCIWGGALSALILPGKEVVQVKAKTSYLKLTNKN